VIYYESGALLIITLS